MSEADKKLNFVSGNIVYIHGEFDKSVMTDVIDSFTKLIDEQSKLKDGKIIVNICSNGGYLFTLAELLALVELAKDKGVIVETRAMSTALSCGAILLMSGSKGHRYASNWTQVVIHYGERWTRCTTQKQFSRQSEWIKYIDEVMLKTVRKYTIIPESEIQEMFHEDDYTVKTEDLLTFGIVDHII